MRKGLVLNDGGPETPQPKVGSKWPLDAIVIEKVSLMQILNVPGRPSCPTLDRTEAELDLRNILLLRVSFGLIKDMTPPYDAGRLRELRR